jgi:hypothetical protein
LGGGPIAGIVIGSIAGIALVAFLLLRIHHKHRKEIQLLQLQQLQNPSPLQNRGSYASQPYSPGSPYYDPNKDGFTPGSPPMSETTGSPHVSGYNRSPNYMGPTIAEMATDEHTRPRP